MSPYKRGSESVLFKHGLKKHPIYSKWSNIKSRCYNKKRKEYPNYGGRGILMCDEWLNSFIDFYNWCINNGYDERLTLDRINNDLGYTPDNCRFVGREIQTRNQRTRKNSVTGYKGVTARKPNKKGISKYISLITVGGKVINLGQYATPIEGYEARLKFIKDNNLTDFI